MADPFDPYHTWLGIPPEEQPPNHYRLLGVRMFEDNLDVLENASDQRMSHLRGFQSGPRAEYADQLLNEVTLARLCLLDNRKKVVYDAEISASLKPVEPQDDDAGVVDGSVFGEYILLDMLGKGVTGHVFKAKHRTMGRFCALKVMTEDMTDTPDKLARFHREVKILAQLSHPNLVMAHDAGERDGDHYLVTELVEGETLAALVKRTGELPLEHALNYIVQTAGVLGFIHAHGVYHRNIKPSKLIVSPQGLIKLTGLGLAYVDERFTSLDAHVDDPIVAGRVMGTVDYMAPEQTVADQPIDHRADIYALGCTLYAIMTGRPPYPFKTPHEKLQAHRQAPIPSLFEWRNDVPYALDGVFRQMLAKNPAERPQSMSDVIAGLQAY